MTVIVNVAPFPTAPLQTLVIELSRDEFLRLEPLRSIVLQWEADAMKNSSPR